MNGSVEKEGSWELTFHFTQRTENEWWWHSWWFSFSPLYRHSLFCFLCGQGHTERIKSQMYWTSSALTLYPVCPVKYWNSRQRAKSKCYISVQNLCSFSRAQILQIAWSLERFEVIDGKLCLCLRININYSKIRIIFQNWSVENIHLKRIFTPLSWWARV